LNINNDHRNVVDDWANAGIRRGLDFLNETQMHSKHFHVARFLGVVAGTVVFGIRDSTFLRNEFADVIGELAVTVNLHVSNLLHVSNHFAMHVDVTKLSAETFGVSP
jgi:hypothetical protein